MKTKKLLILIISIILCAAVFSACGDGGEKAQLSKPVNLKIADGILTWNSVAGADSYNVRIYDEKGKNFEDYSVNASFYNVSVLTSSIWHVIYIKAIGNNKNYTNSEWSNSIKYYQPDEVEVVQPVSVQISDLIITWATQKTTTPVTTDSIIFINGNEYILTAEDFNLKLIDLSKYDFIEPVTEIIIKPPTGDFISTDPDLIITIPDFWSNFTNNQPPSVPLG